MKLIYNEYLYNISSKTTFILMYNYKFLRNIKKCKYKINHNDCAITLCMYNEIQGHENFCIIMIAIKKRM